METCEWKYHEDDFWDYWESGCGDKFIFNEGTPQDSGFKFCPFCGKVISLAKHPGHIAS